MLRTLWPASKPDQPVNHEEEYFDDGEDDWVEQDDALVAERKTSPPKKKPKKKNLPVLPSSPRYESHDVTWEDAHRQSCWDRCRLAVSVADVLDDQAEDVAVLGAPDDGDDEVLTWESIADWWQAEQKSGSDSSSDTHETTTLWSSLTTFLFGNTSRATPPDGSEDDDDVHDQTYVHKELLREVMDRLVSLFRRQECILNWNDLPTWIKNQPNDDPMWSWLRRLSEKDLQRLLPLVQQTGLLTRSDNHNNPMAITGGSTDRHTVRLAEYELEQAIAAVRNRLRVADKRRREKWRPGRNRVSYQRQFQQSQGALLNLENCLSTLQQKQDQVLVTKALQDSTLALKGFEGMSVDEVTSIVQENEEAIAEIQQVNDALAEAATATDDDEELMLQLEALCLESPPTHKPQAHPSAKAPKSCEAPLEA